MVKTRTHQQEKHFMSLVEKFPSNLVMTQMTSYCCNKLLMERLTLQSDGDCSINKILTGGVVTVVSM